MIQSIHTCDRCGVTSGPVAKGKDAPLTTHFAVIGLPDPIDCDLCEICRSIVSSAIWAAITPKPVTGQQELLKT
jgi:hypothetical protein